MKCLGPAGNGMYCNTEAVAAGLCPAHYQQKRRGTELRPVHEPGERVSGVRVSVRALRALQREAKHLRVGIATVIHSIVEAWAEKR